MAQPELVPINTYGLIQSQWSLGTQVYKVNCGEDLDEVLTCAYPASDKPTYGIHYINIHYIFLLLILSAYI